MHHGNLIMTCKLWNCSSINQSKGFLTIVLLGISQLGLANCLIAAPKGGLRRNSLSPMSILLFESSISNATRSANNGRSSSNSPFALDMNELYCTLETTALTAFLQNRAIKRLKKTFEKLKQIDDYYELRLNGIKLQNVLELRSVKMLWFACQSAWLKHRIR